MALELLISQVPQGRPADKLAIGCEEFGGPCRSYVSHDAADVSRTTNHDGLWHFAIGHIDVRAG